jgi:hypothetical protein
VLQSANNNQHLLHQKAKKPKGVAAETGISSVSSPPAEVGKETSASNVAEEEQKMPALPKYVAVPREVFGAGAVPVEQSVAVEAIKGQGVAGEKLEVAEDKIRRRMTMMTMILAAAMMRRRRSRAMREANTPLWKMALKVQLTSQMTQWPTSTICQTK